MSGSQYVLRKHLRELSRAYTLAVADDYEWMVVQGFRLPPGFNYSFTDILVELPWGYPSSPPGVDSHVYVRPDIRFWGAHLRDVHDGVDPGWGDWAWLCYEYIKWDPCRDDLIKFMEMIRADLTCPKTK